MNMAEILKTLVICVLSFTTGYVSTWLIWGLFTWIKDQFNNRSRRK